MPERQISIQTNERVYIVGKTRSGKTFLARHLLRPVRRLIVADPKAGLASWGLQDWNHETIRSFEEGEDVRLRIVPEPGQDLEQFWDEALWMVYEVGDCVLYIDEAYLLTEGNRYPQSLMFIWTTGRERDIGAFSVSQRPRHIPKYLISEAEHFFVFRLLIEEDRKYVAGFTHAAMVAPIPRDDSHGFWYMSLEMLEPIYVSQLPSDHGDEWGELAELEEAA